MADFCHCDLHGVCGEYNSSRFSDSELLYHKEWDELYDSSIGEFRRNITVCYCNTGWTGYSDVGTFDSEVLRNCAISQVVMTVLWTISSICHTALALSMIKRSLNPRKTGKGIREKPRLALRFVAIVAFLGIANAKVAHISEPWLVTIGISPVITVVYLLGMLCFMFDITETQHKQAQMCYSKMFQDFEFGNRIKVEHVHIVFSLRIQQACITFSVIFLGVAVMYGETTTRVAAVLVFLGVVFLILVVDVLIVDPKTNARFLVILKRLIEVNSTGSEYQAGNQSAGFSLQDTSPGPVRMNSANDNANARLQEVYAKVAVLNRTKRVQICLYVLSCIPFYNRNWWKYLGYNVVLNSLLYAFAKAIIYTLKLRDGTRKRKHQNNKTLGTNHVRSSEVSVFHSTSASVVPLISN